MIVKITLRRETDPFSFSARVFYRILKVGRIIADIEREEKYSCETPIRSDIIQNT